MSKIDELARELVGSNKNKTSAYDTTAKVLRVENGIAWVHIPGGVYETPVRKTIDVKTGDEVQIRVGGGKAWITGNQTAPPTDDSLAKKAYTQAEKAYNRANKVRGEFNSVAKQAEQMAELVVEFSSDIENLQDQIDGNITTWFYAYEPTTLNYPASEWISEGTENVHLGDLFYDTVTGYAYRWTSDGSEPPVYAWLKITDTDVTKALADAAKAQDTADSKRRIFYTTPVPPYDKGDLWVQGSNGEIMRCKTDRTESQHFSVGDWVKASKYTDDTVANQALGIAGNTNQYFWHTESGTDTGAHITEVTQEEFLDDPDNGGGNLLARSNGIAVRDGLTELATFGASGVQVGQSSAAHSVIDADGQRFYASDGTTQLANIGYGEGNADSGTSTAPYYTFGTRDSSKRIGNYSMAEGYNVAPIAYTSHAEGKDTTASGPFSHAEGRGTTAQGVCSYTSGDETVAYGYYSRATGRGTAANGASQTVIGEWNTPEHVTRQETRGDWAFVIGNGTSNSNLSNAFVVDWDGNIYAAGRTSHWCYINSITATTISSTNTDKVIPITGINNSSSSSVFSKSGNGVKIAAEGMYIVSIGLSCDTATSRDLMGVTIYKNGTASVGPAYTRMGGNYDTIILSPTPISIAANDILTVYGRNNTSARGNFDGIRWFIRRL